ncbi:MAG: DUF3786 domain-containing protein [Oscillospiraceae bacterium]|nr:DUF3786 domain-containing protein [Oscillospiraceae bacterium]
MQVENHKEGVPFEYYVNLFKSLDPAEAANRTGAAFDGEAFTVRLLGTDYRIAWPEYAISSAAPDAFALKALPPQTFLLRYLLEGKAVAWKGQWKTFREMPWGELYIQPFTGRCLTRAAFTFGTRVAKFAEGAEKLGGRKLPNGDAGYELELLPGYLMQIIVWEGDEEFPPNSQILYSDNFETGFAAEDRVVAGDILITVIKSHM